MDAYLVPGVRLRAKAWRMLYRSTSAVGEPTVVSGAVLVAVVALCVIVGTGGRGPFDPYWLGGLVLTLSITACMCKHRPELSSGLRAIMDRGPAAKGKVAASN